MKNLFLVFAKLLGLVLLYLVLITSFQIIGLFFWALGDHPPVPQLAAGLLLSLLALFASLAAVWLLLVRTEWLAGKLNLNTEAPLGAFTPDSALVVGLTLIGVYLAVRSLSQIAATAVNLLHPGTQYPEFHVLRQFLPGLVQLAAGLLLSVKARAIAARLAPPPRD
ncbi:MAG TPA: hypothetical protein PLK81_06400 [Kiritimatiellia bacterium]|nr:hypothetical protein [Kiritimatiellia bacterium]